jgi:hypothetical protein
VRAAGGTLDRYGSERRRKSLHRYGLGMSASNSTIRTTEAFWSLCFAGEYDAAIDMMHQDFVHDDRRGMLTNTIFGRDQTMVNNRTVVELGIDSVEFEPVAVRGDLLALARVQYRTAGGDEMTGLQLLGTNEDGLRTFCVSFDPDDLDRALAELDARHRSNG